MPIHTHTEDIPIDWTMSFGVPRFETIWQGY